MMYVYVFIIGVNDLLVGFGDVLYLDIIVSEVVVASTVTFGGVMFNVIDVL